MLSAEEIVKENKLSEKNFNVTLIEGKNCLKRPFEHPINFNYFVEPKNISNHMINCDYAFTNGGSTMLELMCIGTAVHVCPQTKNEEKFSDYMLDQGAIISNNPTHFEIPSIKHINETRRKAMAIIDTEGTRRIIKELQRL